MNMGIQVYALGFNREVKIMDGKCALLYQTDISTNAFYPFPVSF